MSGNQDKRSARCIHCGAGYRVAASREGKPAKCPKCEKTFVVQFPVPLQPSSTANPPATTNSRPSRPPQFRQPTPPDPIPAGRGLITLPLWILIVVCTLPPLVFLTVGYFAGREHLKYQMRSAMRDAGRKFAEDMKNIFDPDADSPDDGKAGRTDRPEPPARPEVNLGEEFDAGSFSVAVVGAKVGPVSLKWAGDMRKVSENSLLMIALRFTNNDTRKAFSFHEDRMGFRSHFRLRDDVGNVIRSVNFGMMSKVIGSIEQGEQLKPESSLFHTEVFDKPLPKTEELILTIDLDVFDGDGEVEVRIPIGSVDGFDQ